MELTLNTKYKKNTGLVISAGELLDLYFYGIIIQSKDGSDLSSESIEFYIQAAQHEIEQSLKIKLNKQLFDDSVSYYRDDYKWSYPIIKTCYPVNEPLSLIGMLNKVEQVTYPKEWLQSHVNSDGYYKKRISVVPCASTSVGTSQDFILTGLISQLGLGSSGNIPDYWHMQYITGYSFDNIPFDLLNMIGMLSAIPLLAIAGDLILGAGIASQSLGVDGLSQLISSTSSATNSGYGARIIEYRKSIDKTFKRINKIYKGLSFTVL